MSLLLTLLFSIPAFSEVPTVGKAEAPSRFRLDFVLEPAADFSMSYASDSNGSTAKVGSKNINPSLLVGFATAWPEQWQTSITFLAKYLNLQSLSSSDTLTNPGNLAWRLAVGAAHQFCNDFSARFELGLSRSFFLIRSSAASLAMHGLAIGDVTANGQWRLFDWGDVGIGPSVHLGFLLPGSDNSLSAKAGFSYRVGLFAKRIDSGLPMSTSIYFEQKYQNTNLTNWHTSELGLLFSLQLNLLGGE